MLTQSNLSPCSSAATHLMFKTEVTGPELTQLARSVSQQEMPLQCWDYKCSPPCLGCFWFVFVLWGLELRSSYLKGKHFTKLSSQP